MDKLSIFADIVNAFFTVFLGYLLYTLFGKPKYSFVVRITASGIATILFTLSLRFVETGIVRFLILFIITFVISFLSSMKTLHRFLYSVLYISLCVLAEGITAMIVSKILAVDMSHSTEGLFYVLGTLISKFLTLVVVMLIRLGRHKSLIGISVKHVLVLLMIPFSTLLVLVLQYNYDYIITIPHHWIWFLSVAYLLLVLSNMAVFVYIDSLYQNAIDQGKLSATTQIIKEQEKQYIAIQQHYNEIAKFRHDQKNINIGILSTLQKGEINEAVRQLQECISFLSAPNIHSSGVIHTVVDIKSTLAKENHVRFNFEYKELQKLVISDIDIAILLGNALDNAIESAVEVPDEQRIIELLITVQNNNLVIYIKNPVATDVDVTHLTSRKKHPENHGFGIISMKQIAEKFRGDIVFKCENHIFEVYIVLPNIAN